MWVGFLKDNVLFRQSFSAMTLIVKIDLSLK